MNDSCVIERTSSIVVVRTEAKLKKDKGTRTCGDRRDDIERKTVAVGTWKNRLGVDGGGGGEQQKICGKRRTLASFDPASHKTDVR